MQTDTVEDTVGSIRKGLLFCVPGNDCSLLNKVIVKNLIIGSLSFILPNILWQGLLVNVFHVWLVSWIHSGLEYASPVYINEKCKCKRIFFLYAELLICDKLYTMATFCYLHGFSRHLLFEISDKKHILMQDMAQELNCSVPLLLNNIFH